MEKIVCSWTGRLNTAKMPVLPKAIYRLSAIPSKNPNDLFFPQNRTIHPKIHMALQKNLKIQNHLEKEKVGGLTLPAFKTYYKTIVIKTV